MNLLAPLLPNTDADVRSLIQLPRDGASLTHALVGRYADRITGHFEIPGREGAYAPVPDRVPDALASAPRARGIDRQYSHQAEAWLAAQRGEHVAIVPPTASGKLLLNAARGRSRNDIAGNPCTCFPPKSFHRSGRAA